jgi:hypothetical protein
LVLEIGGAFAIYSLGALWAYKTGRVFRVTKSGASLPPIAPTIALEPVISVEYQEKS